MVLVVLVSAGWSWLLSPWGLVLLELRLEVVLVALLPELGQGNGWILYEYQYV